MKLNQDKTIMTGVVKRVGDWGHTVPLAKKHEAMKIDYRGMVHAIQNGLKPSDGINRFMITELGKHLTELGERFYNGDMKVVDEFLQLYCIAKEQREEVIKQREQQVQA